MSEFVIEVRENGPFLVSGPVVVVDRLGSRHETPEGANVALCRCGVSGKRPFCDGTHKKNGFTATEAISGKGQ